MPFCKTRRNTLSLGPISAFFYLYLAIEVVLTFDSVLTKPVREENLRSMLLIADEQRKSRTASPSLMGSPGNQNTIGDLT